MIFLCFKVFINQDELSEKAEHHNFFLKLIPTCIFGQFSIKSVLD